MADSMRKNRRLRDVGYRLGWTRPWRSPERKDQHFVHRSHGMEGQPFTHVGRQLLELTDISLRDHDVANAATMRGDRLLSQPSDPEHPAAQGDLAGHGRIAANR